MKQADNGDIVNGVPGMKSNYMVGNGHHFLLEPQHDSGFLQDHDPCIN